MSTQGEQKRVYALIRALYAAARTTPYEEERLELFRKAAALEEALLRPQSDMAMETGFSRRPAG